MWEDKWEVNKYITCLLMLTTWPSSTPLVNMELMASLLLTATANTFTSSIHRQESVVASVSHHTTLSIIIHCSLTLNYWHEVTISPQAGKFVVYFRGELGTLLRCSVPSSWLLSLPQNRLLSDYLALVRCKHGEICFGDTLCPRASSCVLTTTYFSIEINKMSTIGQCINLF